MAMSTLNAHSRVLLAAARAALRPRAEDRARLAAALRARLGGSSMLDQQRSHGTAAQSALLIDSKPGAPTTLRN